jgi:hypothetical protein
MKKRLFLLLSGLPLLASCYAWEMVLEDPFDSAGKREADLCALEIDPNQNKSADYALAGFNASLSRQFPRELALQVFAYQGAACQARTEEALSTNTEEESHPLLIQGQIKAQEWQENPPAYPLGWPQPKDTTPILEMKMELSLNIWQRKPIKLLKQISVSDTARSAQSNRSVMLTQLQERLLQKAFQALQTHYTYR